MIEEYEEKDLCIYLNLQPFYREIGAHLMMHGLECMHFSLLRYILANPVDPCVKLQKKSFSRFIKGTPQKKAFEGV